MKPTLPTQLTREQTLRWRILDEYGSLRKFAAAVDVPYSTLLTLLTRGGGRGVFRYGAAHLPRPFDGSF